MHRITAGCACLQCAWRIRHCRWWFELPVKGALSTLISTSTFSWPHPRPLFLHRTHQQRQQLLTSSQILASGRPQDGIRRLKILMKASFHHQAQMHLQAASAFELLLLIVHVLLPIALCQRHRRIPSMLMLLFPVPQKTLELQTMHQMTQTMPLVLKMPFLLIGCQVCSFAFCLLLAA